METLFEMETKEFNNPELPLRWWTKKDVDAVIEHYAITRGISPLKLKIWYKGNYVRNIKAARFVLDYCGNLNDALQVIDNCKIDREKNRLEWSLAGDIVGNIQKYVNQKSETGDKKSWH